MKKTILLAVGVAALLAVVFVFGSKVTVTTSMQKDVVKIGIIGPFSGPLAGYGEAHRNGFMLAAEQLGAASHNVEFIYEDSEFDTAKAVAAFRKLTTVDKVDLVVDWGAATSYGIAPLAKDAGVPFIAISIDPATVKASDYVFRDNPSPDDVAAKLWEHFREKGYKNVAIVNLKMLYFDLIVESLEKQRQAGEQVTIVDTHYSFGDSDFRTSIAKLKNLKSKPDTLGVFLAGGQIAQFYKQADQQELKVPTFGTDFFESRSEISDAGGLMDGAVYVNMGTSDTFVTEYTSRFNTDDQISYAGLSYDLARILMTDVDFTDATSVIDSLKAIKDYPGSIGTYSYSDINGDRYLRPTLYIKEIQGNNITTVR